MVTVEEDETVETVWEEVCAAGTAVGIGEAMTIVETAAAAAAEVAISTEVAVAEEVDMEIEEVEDDSGTKATIETITILEILDETIE